MHQPGKKKGNAAGGNRREHKLKKEIKELRQKIAKTSNELYRRKQRRKATAKEKAILKELRTKSQKDTTSSNLRNVLEIWLDQMRYKKVKLAKYTEKRRRKQDNIMFQRDQKGFFRTLEEDGTRYRGDARNRQICGFLGWYMGEKRTNTLYAMDGGNRKTASSKGKQC